MGAGSSISAAAKVLIMHMRIGEFIVWGGPEGL